MKPIKLTEKQKDNLIEMCNKLFPEYTGIDIRDYNDECFPISKQDAPCIFFWTNRKYEVFHWFEFCYTELAYKILDSENNSKYVDDCTEVDLFTGFCTIHPIDFLYKEFKKIKK